MDYFEAINPLALVAERKIQEAMAEGQFDNLPGRGRPQKLEDLSHLPEDMRLAYIVLKNSGFMNGEGGPDRKPAFKFAPGFDLETRHKKNRLEFLLSRAQRAKAKTRDEAEAPLIEISPLEPINPEYVDKLLKKV